MKPHKISTHSDNCYLHFFYRLSDWVEIFQFFFKQMLKISAFYLVKQKSFIPKKIGFRPLSISKQKSFVYWPNFQRRLWYAHWYSGLKAQCLVSIRSPLPTNAQWIDFIRIVQKVSIYDWFVTSVGDQKPKKYREKKWHFWEYFGYEPNLITPSFSLEVLT